MILIEMGSSNRNNAKIGWQYESPQIGKSYVLYITKGNNFSTREVKDIKKTYYALFLKTVDSLFRVEPLE
jgi:hypothetical protein